MEMVKEILSNEYSVTKILFFSQRYYKQWENHIIPDVSVVVCATSVSMEFPSQLTSTIKFIVLTTTIKSTHRNVLDVEKVRTGPV